MSNNITTEMREATWNERDVEGLDRINKIDRISGNRKCLSKPQRVFNRKSFQSC